MKDTAARSDFSGERLHQGEGKEELFAADLARHEAAYRFAADHLVGEAGASPRGAGLDLGSGSGYGVARLAELAGVVVGLDRVPPDPIWRRRGRFVCGDLNALPLADQSVAWVVSFQVIEHLADPGPYLAAVARTLRDGGVALLSTPNRRTSDGSNPFHVREYMAEELAALLAPYFVSVELLGVGTSAAAQRFLDERNRRVARILRLDPLGLRRLLPRRLRERLFGLFAQHVRRAIRRRQDLGDLDWNDFPVGPVRESSIDLLAVCRVG